MVDKRRFPRAKEDISVQLTLDDGKRQFEANVHSVDISLTGIFLARGAAHFSQKNDH